jgi:hypothetical protein
MWTSGDLSTIQLSDVLVLNSLFTRLPPAKLLQLGHKLSRLHAFLARYLYSRHHDMQLHFFVFDAVSLPCKPEPGGDSSTNAPESLQPNS